MLPRPTHLDSSRSGSCADCRELPAEIVKLQSWDQDVSRVSTDSDLDLETEEEDEYDGDVEGEVYRNPFADLLRRKLEQVQHQNLSREMKEDLSTPVQQFELAEESYWEKMRRISQWRVSTHQSEASSDYSPPEPDTEPPLAAPSRKRCLSDASIPNIAKRARVSAPSPPSSDSFFFPYTRSYSLGLPMANAYGPGAYPRAYVTSVPSYSALHVCTACDAAFASRQRLRRHGRGASTPESCRAAVTYVLE